MSSTLNPPPYDVLLGLLGVSLTEGRGVVDPGTGKVRDPADQAFVGVERPAGLGTGMLWFPETRHTITGKFLEYWQRYGGLSQFGYPLSEPFTELSETDGRPYVVQYFERNRFELHPEKQAPYEVELGLLGAQQYRATAVPAEELPIAPPRGVKSSKDTLTVGMSRMLTSLFPADYYDRVPQQRAASAPIFNSVVGSDGYGRLWPELAWYVPAVENGGAYYAGTGDGRHLVVKYKLRRGIKWSDGVEVTVADLLYYHDLLLDSVNGAEDDWMQFKVDGIETPDKYTAVVSFFSCARAQGVYPTAGADQKSVLKEYVEQKRPAMDHNYPLVLNALPAHILAKIPELDPFESDFALQPVGTGPFMVGSKDWRTSDIMTLVRNPNYNLTDPPLLSRIVFQRQSDPFTALRQVTATGPDALDAVTRDVFAGLWVNPSLFHENLKGVEVDMVPGPVWERIDMNLERPGLSDNVVRQAIGYAIDRASVQRYVDPAGVEVLNTFLPPVSWASMQNPQFAAQWATKFPLHVYDYDPARANRMLDDAGWVRGADGTRAKDGVRLDFRIYTTMGYKTEGFMSGVIQSNLRAIGIASTLTALPICEDFGCLPWDHLELTKGEFDMSWYRARLWGDPSFGTVQYDSQEIFTPQNVRGWQNQSRYRNPRFDELSRAASKEIDRTKRAPLFAEMQSIWTEDLPALPLYARANIEVHKASLVGWETSGGDTPATYRAAALYFK